jgi:hypothetical protein
VEYYKQEIKRMVELSLMLVLAHLIGDFYSNPLLGSRIKENIKSDQNIFIFIC